MKAILLLFISLHVLTTGFAQTELSGIITDERGRPIPFANISLEGTYDGTSTGINGAFAFSTADDGNTYLLVSSQNIPEGHCFNGNATGILYYIKGRYPFAGNRNYFCGFFYSRR